MLLREDSEREKGSKWERRKTKGEIPEPSRARGSHLAHHHIYFSSPSAVPFGNTKTKCKSSFHKNKKEKKKAYGALTLLAFWAAFYVLQQRTRKKRYTNCTLFVWLVYFNHTVKQPDWIWMCFQWSTYVMLRLWHVFTRWLDLNLMLVCRFFTGWELWWQPRYLKRTLLSCSRNSRIYRL